MRNSAYDVTTMSASDDLVQLRAARGRVSVIVTTVTSGANRAASWAQFDTTLVGATTRNVGRVVVVHGRQRQRLHGLPQPHVVGEDPAQAVAVQERQPVESVLLVVAQRGVSVGGAAMGSKGLQRA